MLAPIPEAYCPHVQGRQETILLLNCFCPRASILCRGESCMALGVCMLRWVFYAGVTTVVFSVFRWCAPAHARGPS